MPFLFYKQLSGIGRHYILDSRYELCHQFHHLIFCCCVQVWQSGGIIRIHQWSLPCRHCCFRLHWSSGEVIWAPRSQYRKIAGKDMCVCLSVLPYIWCGVCLFAFSSVHAASIFLCCVVFCSCSSINYLLNKKVVIHCIIFNTSWIPCVQFRSLYHLSDMGSVYLHLAQFMQQVFFVCLVFLLLFFYYFAEQRDCYSSYWFIFNTSWIHCEQFRPLYPGKAYYFMNPLWAVQVTLPW